MTLEGVRFKTVRPAAAYLEVLRGYYIKLVHSVPNSRAASANLSQGRPNVLSPNFSIHQFKPVQQIRQKLPIAYSPNTCMNFVEIPAGDKV